jgi:hypothetical protein
MEIVSKYNVGGVFLPRLYGDHNTGVEDNIRCYGGLNITNPAALDPTTGILYVASARRCGGGMVIPGIEADDPEAMATTGTTLSQWVAGPGGGMGTFRACHSTNLPTAVSLRST